MPIEVRDLRGLDGPNLYYGQPAVKLQTWSDRDLRRDIADGIKRWAQVTGIVIGYLQHAVVQMDGGFLMTTTFTTPFPNVGERVAEAVVADLQAAERGDEDYSHDDLMFEIIDLRKREEPSLPLLQVYAEARARDLPFLHRDDATIMVGSGSRGFVFDPAGFGLGLAVDIPWDSLGRIPILAVTGTNGKTTTVRLCAHVLAATGKRVGRTDTDGIVVDGEEVEEGDWAGFGGARRVLADPRVDVAVLETSRGGILRRGLGFDYCDVSVITNISGDHLGELGVDTLEELARVKGLVALVTRADGRVVLNADDEHVAALADYVGAPVVWFSRKPDQERVRQHLAAGGDALWSDGDRMEIAFAGTRATLPLAEIPVTVGGAAVHNVENVLAAAAACLSLGVEIDALERALRSFTGTDADNPGRLNLFETGGVTVVLDYAHNEAAIASLAAFGERQRQQSGGRLLAVLGGPGDRPDATVVAQGRRMGTVAEWLLLHEEERYRRGRPERSMFALYRRGAEEVGLAPERILEFPDELAAVRHALTIARPGDVVVAAAHAQREEVVAALRAWAEEPPTTS